MVVGAPFRGDVEGKIVPSLQDFRFHVIYQSTIMPSLAGLRSCKSCQPAAIVMGRNANGLNEWKMKDGRTLRGWK